MHAVELNSLNLLLVGKSCFSGHVKTLLHLTQLALLATFPKLGSCKYLHFTSHLPVEMRCMHEMKNLHVARQLVRPDQGKYLVFKQTWSTSKTKKPGFDDQVLSRDINISVKQFLESCEAASIQVYRLKLLLWLPKKKKKKAQTLILQIKQAISILLLKKPFVLAL